jgi:hypothetical protein
MNPDQIKAEIPAAEEVRRLYLEMLRDYKPRIFGWPGDSLCAYAWQYWIHVEWVQAWNATGRVMECAAFLREWLAVDANIETALEKMRAHESRA